MPQLAYASIGKHFAFYNQRRPHTEHGGETPDAMYFGLTNPENLSKCLGPPLLQHPRSAPASTEVRRWPVERPAAARGRSG